jgi:hypothetical protein
MENGVRSADYGLQSKEYGAGGPLLMLLNLHSALIAPYTVLSTP